jgi:hypothetical protein
MNYSFSHSLLRFWLYFIGNDTREWPFWWQILFSITNFRYFLVPFHLMVLKVPIPSWAKLWTNGTRAWSHRDKGCIEHTYSITLIAQWWGTTWWRSMKLIHASWVASRPSFWLWNTLVGFIRLAEHILGTLMKEIIWAQKI